MIDSKKKIERNEGGWNDMQRRKKNLLNASLVHEFGQLR